MGVEPGVGTAVGRPPDALDTGDGAGAEPDGALLGGAELAGAGLAAGALHAAAALASAARMATALAVQREEWRTVGRRGLRWAFMAP